MLSMSAMSSGQASYYLGLAREDYYLQGGEPPGQWQGEGAHLLGLQGEVQDQQLYNLFDGLSPDGSRPLVQFQRHDGKAEHRPGWDLTFSAPKSVSVLWSQASEENRHLLQAAHHAAVQAALGYLQETAALTRRGKGGGEFETTGLVIASFEHSTSRALDPQLHTHALVMNIGVREDGTTGTVSSLSLFEAKMAAGALYRVELASRLERELGIPVERTRTWFEIPGVSEDLIQEFSKRREAIEEELLRKGLTSAEAAAVAATETREAKEAVSRAELFAAWRKDGQHYEWTTRQADQLFRAVRVKRNEGEELERAGEQAILRLTQSQAHFTQRDFVRFMAEEAQASGLSAAQVIEGAQARLLHSDDIVRLGRYYGEERFTTKEMLSLEKSLLAATEKLSQSQAHVVSAEGVMRTLSQHGELSEEQMKALWHVTTGTGGIAVVSGMAGTGKTRMLDVARSAWEAEGFHVEGGALAGRAAQQLSDDAHFQTRTIAKYLNDIERGAIRLDAQTILVLDEAGMIATPELEKLAVYCAKVGAKLVLIGDERQLQPIGPGAPFLELGERYGHAELQDIRRQSEAWARKAVKDLAAGRSREALEAFTSRGLVKVAETRDEAMIQLVKEWSSDSAPLGEKLILAGKRNEVQALNRLAQAERLSRGELHGEPLKMACETYYLGDQVIFTKPHKTMGVLNGERGVVESIGAAGSRVAIRLYSGERVSFEPDAIQDIALGYATTTHKFQGGTGTNSYILAGGPMQDREMSYVQGSRARDKTTFYLTKLDAGDEIERLAREMQRSRQKDMAHTILREQIENERNRQEHRRRQ